MTLSDLANRIDGLAKGKSRLIVAISGPPGAGKSTLAEKLFVLLNAKGEHAAIVPMDGFHLDNEILKERGLLERKGSPDSFDGEGFVHLIKRLHASHTEVAIPVFDRDRDIAIAGAEIVASAHRILLVEGNYLLIEKPPWSELRDYWDHSIFINPGLPELRNRLIRRWVDYGIPEDQAVAKAENNDIANAEFVLSHSTSADVTLTQEGG